MPGVMDTAAALRSGAMTVAEYVAVLLERNRQCVHLNGLVSMDEGRLMGAARACMHREVQG
jgi:hypothetical protein